MPDSRPLFTEEAKTRKTYPIYSGVLCYFPAAIAEVSRVSHVGNEQHNPGKSLHWDRSKSTDQGDTAIRHMMDHDNNPKDTDDTYHLAKAAWRILAKLQLHLESEGAPVAPLATNVPPSNPLSNAASTKTNAGPVTMACKNGRDPHPYCAGTCEQYGCVPEK